MTKRKEMIMVKVVHDMVRKHAAEVRLAPTTHIASNSGRSSTSANSSGY
jgi:hypothetical protein